MSKSRRRKRNPQSGPGGRPAQVISSQSGSPPTKPASAEQPAPSERPALPPRAASTGVAVVPSELMARLQRQWIWFLVVTILAVLLAGSSIGGWLMYVRTVQAQRGPRAELVRLRDEVSGLQNDLQERQARLSRAETELADALKALAGAEARVASSGEQRSADQSRVMEAERRQIVAEAKVEALEREKAELQTQLDAAGQARRELEEKLAAAQAGRDDAESRRAAAESRADEARRELGGLQEQMARLDADVQRYRDEAERARAEHRRAVAAVLETRPAAEPQAETQEAVAAAHAEERTEEAVTSANLERPTEGTIAAVVIGRDPSAARTRPEETEDPLLRDASAHQVRGWGEAMIVAGNPQRAVELLRKAIEKGGGGAGYQKSLGWALLQAGRKDEARAALEAALAGYEDWAATSADASPDHWTAAFLLGRVPEDEYTRRYVRVTLLGYRLDCLPWFYVGQRREMEGDREAAVTAYRVCVGLGQLPNAYPIWKWASQRIEILSGGPASAPAR